MSSNVTRFQTPWTPSSKAKEPGDESTWATSPKDKEPGDVYAWAPSPKLKEPGDEYTWFPSPKSKESGEVIDYETASDADLVRHINSCIDDGTLLVDSGEPFYVPDDVPTKFFEKSNSSNSFNSVAYVPSDDMSKRPSEIQTSSTTTTTTTITAPPESFCPPSYNPHAVEWTPASKTVIHEAGSSPTTPISKTSSTTSKCDSDSDSDEINFSKFDKNVEELLKEFSHGDNKKQPELPSPGIIGDSKKMHINSTFDADKFFAQYEAAATQQDDFRRPRRGVPNKNAVKPPAVQLNNHYSDFTETVPDHVQKRKKVQDARNRLAELNHTPKHTIVNRKARAAIVREKKALQRIIDAEGFVPPILEDEGFTAPVHPRQIKQVYLRALASSAFSFPTHDVKQQNELIAKWNLDAACSYNPKYKVHKELAFHREIITNYLLKHTFSETLSNHHNPILHVSLPHGSHREKKAFEMTNNVLFNQFGKMIKTHLHGEYYGNDVAKHPRDPEWNDSFDFGLITDVYHLTPALLAAHIARITTKKIYIIMHNFCGAGGVEFPTTGEGIWYRENDSIYYRPHISDPMYAPHPASEFLFKNGFVHDNHYYVRDFIQKVGPYELFSISLTPYAFPVLDIVNNTDCQIHLQPAINMSFIQRLKLRNLSLLFYQPKPFLVWNCGSLHQYGASLSTFNWMTMCSSINAFLDRDPGWGFFQKAFPDAAATIREDTIGYYYYGRLDIYARNLSWLHTATYSDQQIIASVRNRDAPASWSISFKQALAVLVAFQFVSHIPWIKVGFYTFSMLNQLNAKMSEITNVLSLFPNNHGYTRFLAPIVEEVAKRQFPQASLLIAAAESSSLQEVFWRTLAHYCISRLPLPLAMATHALLNSIQLERNKYIVDRWISNYNNQQIQLDLPMGVYPLPIDTVLREAEWRGPLPALNFKTPGYTQDLPLGENLRETVYPIVAPMNLPFKPAANARNLARALYRVANPPFDPLTEWEGWTVASKIKGIWNRKIRGTFNVTDYINSINDKRKRLRAETAQAHIEAGDVDNHKMTGHCKTDETLFQKWSLSPGGVVEMKDGIDPRFICNVSPVTQNLTQPAIMELSLLMKDYEYNMTVKTIDNIHGKSVNFYIFYCAGVAYEIIQDWFSFATTTGLWCFFQGGDDNLIISPDGRLFEGDYTKFDQSQCLGAARYQTSFYKQCLIPDHVIDRLASQFNCPYNAEKKGLNIHKGQRFGRATGGSDTSLGNTVIGVTALVVSIIYYDTPLDELPTVMAQKFGMVLKIHHTLAPTFLKGWFVPVLDKFIWCPLPSMILKLGKVLRSPKEITGKKDISEALRMCAYALGSSFGSVPRDYPILGCFVHKMKSFCPGGTVLKVDEYGHRQQCFVSAVPRAAVLAMIEYRYGIVESDVLELENLINSVTVLPSLIVHPSLVALERGDYQ